MTSYFEQEKELIPVDGYDLHVHTWPIQDMSRVTLEYLSEKAQELNLGYGIIAKGDDKNRIQELNRQVEYLRKRGIKAVPGQELTGIYSKDGQKLHQFLVYGHLPYEGVKDNQPLEELVEEVEKKEYALASTAFIRGIPPILDLPECIREIRRNEGGIHGMETYNTNAQTFYPPWVLLARALGKRLELSEIGGSDSYTIDPWRNVGDAFTAVPPEMDVVEAIRRGETRATGRLFLRPHVTIKRLAMIAASRLPPEGRKRLPEPIRRFVQVDKLCSYLMYPDY